MLGKLKIKIASNVCSSFINGGIGGFYNSLFEWINEAEMELQTEADKIPQKCVDICDCRKDSDCPKICPRYKVGD